MNPSYLKDLEPYNEIGMEKLMQRAKKIKKNKNLAEKLAIIKKEEVEEKRQRCKIADHENGYHESSEFRRNKCKICSVWVE